MRRLNICTATHQAESVWPQATTTWARFVEWLDLQNPADRKDCGCYVLGKLQGERRRKSTVESRSAVVLDADTASASFYADSTLALGSAAAFYTTWSHTPEKPRWRLLAPLSRDVTPDEYRLIVQGLMVELGWEQFDKGSTEPERLMHRPSTQNSYEHHVVDGDPLDADAWLLRARELGIENEPQQDAYLDLSPERPTSEGLHPVAVAAIQAELAKLDALPHPWFAGASWDLETFKVSCNLVEFANSNWSGYTLAAAQSDLFEHAPSDEVWGRKDHAAKFASAMNTVGEGGRPYMESPQDVFDVWEDEPGLFDSTSVLAHVRQAAHARMLSAPALLCYVLARVIAETPAGVCLPPTIGGKASLNLGIAVVGDSGAGKSALLSVSRELLAMTGIDQEDIERPIGSGEGLVQSFLRKDGVSKDLVLIDDPRRIITVDEVDSLGAGKNRTGATIAPTIRSALTGSSLGQENADADRRRNVRANSYRLVLLVGVQPTRSGALLEDADAGTPQRLVWVQANDPSIPDHAEWPGVLPGENMGWSLPARLPDLITYPDHVAAEVRAARLKQMREGTGALEGHRLLTRLKVGAALALLHGENKISDQWWSLAELVIRESMRVQEACQHALEAEAVKANEKQARAAGRAAVTAAEVVDEDKQGVARARAAILRKLDGEDGVAWRDVKRAMKNTIREYAQKARDALEANGQVRIEDVTVGSRQGERLWKA